MTKNTLKVLRLTEEELESRVSQLETKHPWFKKHYEDEEICSCCKIDWYLWSDEEMDDWRNYERYKFLREDK